MDELYDPDKFLITFPVWFLAERGTVSPETKAGDKIPLDDLGLVVGTAGGRECLLLFTDEDLARRFAAGAPMDVVPGAFGTPQELAEALGGLDPAVGHVVFDLAGIGARARPLAVREAVRLLREQSGP